VIDRRCRLQMPEQGEHLVPAHQGATGELTDHKRVDHRECVVEKPGQSRGGSPEVVDPDRGVDERRHSGGATPASRLCFRVAPPERRQTPRTLTGDEGFQPGAHYGRLADDAAEPLSLPEEVVVEDHCGSHRHISMHDLCAYIKTRLGRPRTP